MRLKQTIHILFLMLKYSDKSKILLLAFPEKIYLTDSLQFYLEVDEIKKILSQKVQPQKFIDKFIQNFLNNMFLKCHKLLLYLKRTYDYFTLFMQNVSYC